VAAAAPVEVALCISLACIGALVYGKFFEGRYLTPLLGAAALAAAVAVLADFFAWRAWIAAAVAAVVFVPYAAFVAFPELTSARLPRPAALRAAVEGLANGWARMLSIGLPADVTGELLVTPVFLTGAVSLAAILALRSRATLAPLLPPLLGFVAALAFTASRPERQLGVTAGLLAAGLVLALLRANRLGATDHRGPMVAAAGAAAPAATTGRAGRGRAAMLGRVAFGLPIIALVTAFGVAGTAALPIATGEHRFDPRRLRDQQLEVDDTLSPLVQLKAQLETKPPVELFTVTLEAPTRGAPVDRLRTAALDTYDGALWTTNDRFIVTGRTLPVGQPLRGRVVPVTQRVSVDRLAGPFLPAAGRPAAMTARDFGFDPDSGVLVTSRTRLRGYRYVAQSVAAKPTGNQLRAALPNPDPSLAGASTPPPDVPAELVALADRVTASQASPFGQLRAIERYLRSRYPYSLRSPPGHSFGALRRMLFGNRAERHSYAEQHAAAFALLARVKGFPARVAVGYLLDQRNAEGPDTWTVTTANAHAWPEINLQDYGWVAFEPTDVRNTAPDFLKRNPDAGTGGDARSQPAPSVVPPEIIPELDPYGEGVTGLAARARRILPWAALAGAGVVAAALLVVLAKQQRRRRRRRAKTGAGRILGAWQELTDRLRERGVGVSSSLTPNEVAERARASLGERPASPVAQLAPIVSAAIYASFEPDQQAVEQAWRLEGLARRELGRLTPPAVRVRALVDPRPLLPSVRRNGLADPRRSGLVRGRGA
jgi:transglutaminase-like putative cysteine protease